MKKWLFITLMAITSLSEADDIRVEGVTALKPVDVEEVLSKYQGTSIEIEDVAAVINELNALYRSKGYLNSGVVFPQQSKSETIQLKAVEGVLSDINIAKIGRLKGRYIRKIIEREMGSVLNISQLRKAFNKLERQKTIDSVKGQLKSGSAQGQSVLDLEIIESDAFSIKVTANNYRSPSVGDEQLQVQLSHLNFTGNSDELNLGINHTAGLDSGSIVYSFPINTIKSSLSVYYSSGDTVVVEEPFDAINIQSATDTTGINLETRVIDALSHTLSASLGFDSKTSETTLLGLPYSFSQGSINGESAAAIVTAGISYQYRTRQQALSIKVGWRKGIDILDATIIPGGISDAEFDLFQLQATYVRLIEREVNDWTFSLGFNSQFTSDTLQSFERYALGGHDSVRGFRENLVLKDEAWEVRAQLEIPVYINADTRFVMFPFIDAGRGTNTLVQPNVKQQVDLSSIGMGLRYHYAGLLLQLEWASVLIADVQQDGSLQDDGIHLGLSYRF
jgi:hemolysin activation/secretion protein